MIGIDANGNIYQNGYETRTERIVYLDGTNKELLTLSAKGLNHVVGLNRDGRVFTIAGTTAGNNDWSYINSHHLDTSGWKLFDNANNLEEERREAREVAEVERIATEAKRKRTIQNLEMEREQLSTELRNLRGLFNGRRRKEIEEKLAQIEDKLKKI